MFENSYVLLFVVFFCSIFYLWVKNYPLIDVDYIFLHIYMHLKIPKYLMSFSVFFLQYFWLNYANPTKK